MEPIDAATAVPSYVPGSAFVTYRVKHAEDYTPPPPRGSPQELVFSTNAEGASPNGMVCLMERAQEYVFPNVAVSVVCAWLPPLEDSVSKSTS